VESAIPLSWQVTGEAANVLAMTMKTAAHRAITLGQPLQVRILFIAEGAPRA
jgi:hypothetical protein